MMNISGMALESYVRKFVRVLVTETPDGAGGRNSVISYGEEINGIILHTTSSEVRRAEKDITLDSYTIGVDKEAAFGYMDVIKDISTGAAYAITDPIGYVTPETSILDMKVIKGKRCELNDAG